MIHRGVEWDEGVAEVVLGLVSHLRVSGHGRRYAEVILWV
jgi:hypothetical protein